MHQPILQELRETTDIFDKIEKYKIMVEDAKNSLEETKAYYANHLEVEKQKVRDAITQKKALEVLQAEIDSYREHEQAQKLSLYKSFSVSFEQFLSSDSMKSIISDMIKKMDVGLFKCTVDTKYQTLFVNYPDSIKTSDGKIRIFSDKIEYIVDPEYLKKIIFNKLLTSSDSKK
jgi:hypothetical protein